MNKKDKMAMHNSLIREEYQALQVKYAKLEKENDSFKAAANEDLTTFIGRLVNIVKSLFDESKYSDITIRLKNRSIPGHKFVLEARNGNWSSDELHLVNELDMQDIDDRVAYELIRWVYTDSLLLKSEAHFLLDLLSAACKYKLPSLKNKCEMALISEILVSNCIEYYMKAEELDAMKLKRGCSEMISNHWSDFSAEDFKVMPARLLLDMFQSKTRYPLHAAIKIEREDVVFIYLTDNFTQLTELVNSIDEMGDIPLDMALSNRQDELAETLLNHSADIDLVDNAGRCLLQRAISRGDEFAATFLMQKGCNVNAVDVQQQRTILHSIAAFNFHKSDQSDVREGMTRIAELFLLKGGDPNLQDTAGNTALHLSIDHCNQSVFEVVTAYRDVNLEIQNRENVTPLWLALKKAFPPEAQSNNDASLYATVLISKGADVNSQLVDPTLGDSLCMLASRTGMEQASIFLIEEGAADVNQINRYQETCLHVACSKSAARLVNVLLKRGSNPNVTRRRMNTVKKLVTKMKTIPQERIVNKVRRRMKKAKPSPAKPSVHKPPEVSKVSFKTSSLNPFGDPDESTGNSNPFGDPDDGGEVVNQTSQTDPPPEMVSEYESFDEEEVKIIPERVTNYEEEMEEEFIDCKTPIHLAFEIGHPEIIDCFINYQQHGYPQPNWFLRDANEDTAFSLSLWSGRLDVARRLLDLMSDPSKLIREKNALGDSLVHQAIFMQNIKATLFLLENGANINEKSHDGKTPLQMSIEFHLPIVASKLCEMGAMMNNFTEDGVCPLWQALDSGQEDIACVLVKHNCDVNMWTLSPDGFECNLLHRAIEEKNSAVANFLIRNGCDVNSPRRATSTSSPNDGQTPLHLAARASGLSNVIQALIKCPQADVNAQDSTGQTPLHSAIRERSLESIPLLMAHPKLKLDIRDRSGQTPFHAAMANCNQEAAQAILSRESTAALQVDNRGRNFLHVAVQSADVVSIFFLIQIGVDMNARVQDSHQFSPLHLAVIAGVQEEIVRSLVLAGANINDHTLEKQTCLHLSVLHEHNDLCKCLLDSGINVNAQDNNLNTALHLAMKNGNRTIISTLLTDAKINPVIINLKGETPFHLLCRYAKEGSSVVFEQLMSKFPTYPFDAVDACYNTPLFLAYCSANSRLCISLLNRGASLGCMNSDGVTIFNHPRSSNQLLYSLLDSLSEEPGWSEGENCLECKVRFSIKIRRHHCRHCGRLVCDRCSNNSIPIVKYNVKKPVRVCDICFQFLNNPDDLR